MTVSSLIAKGQQLLINWRALIIGDETKQAMTDAERDSYESWSAIINKQLTLQDLADFLRKQSISLGKELRLAVSTGDDRKSLILSARMENYEAIVSFIDEPDRSREMVVSHLENLIKQHVV